MVLASCPPHMNYPNSTAQKPKLEVADDMSERHGKRRRSKDWHSSPRSFPRAAPRTNPWTWPPVHSPRQGASGTPNAGRGRGHTEALGGKEVCVGGLHSSGHYAHVWINSYQHAYMHAGTETRTDGERRRKHTDSIWKIGPLFLKDFFFF